MVELSHKNHFKYGYNQIPFGFRQSPGDQWFVQYGSCERPPHSFREECIETARLIRQKTKLPLYVMFSGGVDSEVVVRSFVEAGIPVQAAIMRFKDYLNQHDIQWAVQSCEILGVPYQFYDLDLLQFWTSGYLPYSEPTYCISPQLLPTMWLADQIPGYVIMGSGECFMTRTDAPLPEEPDRLEYPEHIEWELHEKEKIAAWFRHFMIRKRDACPGFFQYTPEIMLSYLLDSDVQELCSNKIFGRYTTVSSKLKIYQKHFPNLRSRPKYTGYENVQPEDAKLRAELVSRYEGSNGVFKSKYQDLLKSLSWKEEVSLQNF